MLGCRGRLWAYFKNATKNTHAKPGHVTGQVALKYAEAAAYLRRSSLGSKIEPMETEFSW